MASYTIEDIELIRRKSGISYQEAVALLDYHNGNVARALIDLERNGRIKPEEEQRASDTSTQHHRGKNGLSSLVSRLYRFRLKVQKGNIIILNLSMLFALLSVLISPHLTIIAIIVSLILGYRISFNRNDPDFAGDNLERMVRSAAQNVKSSVSGIAHSFSDQQEKTEEKPAADSKAEKATDDRSFYQSNPAATTYHAAYTAASAPTLQVPVQVESQDGSVKVEKDKDGFTNASIE